MPPSRTNSKVRIQPQTEEDTDGALQDADDRLEQLEPATDQRSNARTTTSISMPAPGSSFNSFQGVFVSEEPPENRRRSCTSTLFGHEDRPRALRDAELKRKLRCMVNPANLAPTSSRAVPAGRAVNSSLGARGSGHSGSDSLPLRTFLDDVPEGSATSEPAHMRTLLCLMRDLLNSYEVKFLQKLLDALASSSLAGAQLSLTQHDLAQALRPFADEQPDAHAGADLVGAALRALQQGGGPYDTCWLEESSRRMRNLGEPLKKAVGPSTRGSPHMMPSSPAGQGRSSLVLPKRPSLVEAVRVAAARRMSADSVDLRDRCGSPKVVPTDNCFSVVPGGVEHTHTGGSSASGSPRLGPRSSGCTRVRSLPQLPALQEPCIADGIEELVADTPAGGAGRKTSPTETEGHSLGDVHGDAPPPPHSAFSSEGEAVKPTARAESPVTSPILAVSFKPLGLDGQHATDDDSFATSSEGGNEDRDDSKKSPVSGRLKQLLRAASASLNDGASLERVTKSDDLEDLSLAQMAWLASPSDPWVLHPNSGGRIFWDILSLLFILFECITLPLAMSFALEMPSEVHSTSMTFFTLDIVLSFMTGYFHKSLLVMRRSWLTLRYVRTWFVLDLVSTVPWDLFVEMYDASATEGTGQRNTTLLRVVKLGKLARVIRLLRFAKITTLLKRFQSSGLMPASVYQLKFGMAAGKMFIVFGFLSHWSACVWGWLGDPPVGEERVPYDLGDCSLGGSCEPGLEGSRWKRRYGMDNFDKGTQYMASLQFTFALMTGGSVPMEAGRPFERIFVIVVMMGSVFICSVVVGEILLIMNRVSEQSMQFDEMLQNSREFMVARKIPSNLQVRVYRYLEGRQQKENGANRDFIGQLSGWLQVELIDCMNRVHICSHPFFKELGSHEAVRRICLEAAPVIFGAGDIVVEAGSVALFMMFLVRGRLHVDLNEHGGGNIYLTPPCWIGDKCIFVDTLRANTVRAITNTEMLQVEKKSVLGVCEEFPEVQEAYDRFREEILNNGFKNLRCTYCQDIGHTESACPVKDRALALEADVLARSNVRSRTGGLTSIVTRSSIMNMFSGAAAESPSRRVSTLSEKSSQDEGQ